MSGATLPSTVPRERTAVVVRPLVVTVLVLSVAVLVAASTELSTGAGPAVADLPEIAWLTSFWTFAPAGTLVLWRLPRNGVGWVFLAVGCLVPLSALIDQHAAAAVAADPTDPTGAALRLLQEELWVLAWGLGTTFALILFPDGHVRGRVGRALAVTSGALLALTLLAAAVAAGPVGAPGAPENPLGVRTLGSVPDVVADVGFAGLGGVALVCLVLVVVRWVRGTEADRRRTAWVALAALVSLVAAVLGEVPAQPAALEAAFLFATVAAVPVGTVLGVLHAERFDVRVLLDRSLVLVALSAVVVGVHAAAVWAAGWFLHPVAGRGLALLVATVVAVSAFPLQHRVVRAVDRALFGERSRPAVVMSSLRARIGDQDPVDVVRAAVSQTLATALRLPSVRLEPEVVDLGPTEEAFGVGGGTGGVRAWIVAGRRSGQRRFSRRDREVLTELAEQIVPVLRAADLAGHLQEARERLVHGREDERRRLRRDLHDGLGPVLAVLALEVDVLRDRLTGLDEGTAGLLDDVRRQIGECGEDVRRLADDLGPADLDRAGLLPAVRARAATLVGLDVEVSGRAEDDLPPAVAVAAYRIVGEALTNVVRHARATRAAVDVSCTAGVLSVSVRDDGAGFGTGAGLDPAPWSPPPGRSGIGLRTMAERAEELGGRFAVTSGPAGTVVTASIPCPGAP